MSTLADELWAQARYCSKWVSLLDVPPFAEWAELMERAADEIEMADREAGRS